MEILIAGGTGFIGRALTKYFLNKNHQITILGRNLEKIKRVFNTVNVRGITWHQLNENGPRTLQPYDIIINLAGANIGSKRWTPQRKQEILTSRVKATTTLAQMCANLPEKKPDLFNANGVGVYGLQTNNDKHSLPLDEDDRFNLNSASDFLSYVGRQWELATVPAQQAKMRVVLMRFGVVLDNSGGVLPQLALPVKFFIGGTIGSGKQPFSWISLTDLIQAIDFLIQHPSIEGPVNLVAPQCVTQRELVDSLGKILHRPTWMKTPAWLLKLLLGQMADELLLKGQHVIPKILLENGFQFKYPQLDQALSAIYATKSQ